MEGLTSSFVLIKLIKYVVSQPFSTNRPNGRNNRVQNNRGQTEAPLLDQTLQLVHNTMIEAKEHPEIHEVLHLASRCKTCPFETAIINAKENHCY